MARLLPRFAVPAAVAVLAVAGCSQQESTPETVSTPLPQVGLPGELSELQSEFAGIQQRLGVLQQQAMQDPAIQTQYDGLESFVESAMTKLDPDFPANRDRLRQLAGDVRAAEASGDTAAVRTIVAEGTTLQAKIQSIQAQTMQDEEVTKRMTDFQDVMRAKMAELDPEAPALLERADAITAELQAPPGG